jgi:hypothetical protein
LKNGSVGFDVDFGGVISYGNNRLIIISVVVVVVFFFFFFCERESFPLLLVCSVCGYQFGYVVFISL